MASLLTVFGIPDWTFSNSKWSIFSLDPLPSDTVPSYPTCTALYLDAFTNTYFHRIFVLGLILFYLLDILGCYIYYNYVPLDQQNKMQREQFAGHFISMIHALMIAGSSTLVTWSYTPFDALNANNNNNNRDLIILIYKYCATMSASYFLLDSIFISYYYKQSISKKTAFVIHHFCSGICMCSVLLTGPIITYISALNFLIEWSTVMLNIRIFARIWSNKYIYFISGISVIITYPFTRIIWNIYMIIISFKSPYLTNYTCPQAPIVLGGAEIFVAVLSTYYYIAVIMAKPQKMYILKNAPKPLEKDC